jgi:hypothetical protein
MHPILLHRASAHPGRAASFFEGIGKQCDQLQTRGDHRQPTRQARCTSFDEARRVYRVHAKRGGLELHPVSHLGPLLQPIQVDNLGSEPVSSK